MRLARFLLAVILAAPAWSQEAPRVAVPPPPEAPRVVYPPPLPEPGAAATPAPGPAPATKPRAVPRTAAAPPACVLPPPSPQAAVVALGLREGQAVSSVALGRPSLATRAIDVVVEPGARPIYLVVASGEQLVVNLRGATSRIERLALMTSASRSGMGATGLPRTRVSFVPQEACGFSWDLVQSPIAGFAFHLFMRRAGLGQAATAGGGDYAFATARVSDTRVAVEKAPERPSNPAVPLRLYPGGVKRFDPAAVVSNVPVSRYETLPSTAGLEQLVADRKIKPATRADLDARLELAKQRGEPAGVIGELRKRAGPIYMVQSRFRMPADLCGPVVVFIVPPNVPAPEGRSCHERTLLPDGRIH